MKGMVEKRETHGTIVQDLSDGTQYRECGGFRVLVKRMRPFREWLAEKGVAESDFVILSIKDRREYFFQWAFGSADNQANETQFYELAQIVQTVSESKDGLLNGSKNPEYIKYLRDKVEFWRYLNSVWHRIKDGTVLVDKKTRAFAKEISHALDE